MGTSVTVELWLEDSQQATRLMDAVMREMRRIDASMSPYIASSELSQLNAKAGGEAVKVSKELFDIVERSNHFSELSGGAFDITFASVGHRYDYRHKVKPGDNEITQLLPLIDYHHLLLNRDAHTIRYARQGVVIDLGGIAKGYAVDRGYALLVDGGVKHAIVTAGGDSRILGDRRGRLWVVGIKNPRGDGHVIKLPVENMAASTSGDYERYFESEGTRYHHIINPVTGKSAKGLRSVTILGENATLTDAMSTTVFVLGAEKGLALVNRQQNMSAVIIDESGRVYYSNDLVSGDE
jgi:thiamine biosynthesis lipoprotein